MAIPHLSSTSFPRIQRQYGCLYSIFSLSHRSFRVHNSSSISSSFTQYEGVPQGSVLSTTLFFISVNGIVSTLPLGVRFSLYVDDLAIYSSGNSLPALHTLIQSAISTASSWATTHGFHFSPTKSFSIIFTRCFTPLRPPLTLYGTPFNTVPQGNSSASLLVRALLGKNIPSLSKTLLLVVSASSKRYPIAPGAPIVRPSSTFTLPSFCPLLTMAATFILQLLIPSLNFLAIFIILPLVSSAPLLLKVSIQNLDSPPFHAVATSSPSGTMPASTNSPQ